MDRLEVVLVAVQHGVRRSGGGGLLIGIAVLILVIVGAYFLLNQSKNDDLQTQAITGAAKSVSDTADKAGDAIDQGSKE